jgi:hypothetical protein
MPCSCHEAAAGDFPIDGFHFLMCRRCMCGNSMISRSWQASTTVLFASHRSRISLRSAAAPRHPDSPSVRPAEKGADGVRARAPGPPAASLPPTAGATARPAGRPLRPRRWLRAPARRPMPTCHGLSAHRRCCPGNAAPEQIGVLMNVDHRMRSHSGIGLQVDRPSIEAASIDLRPPGLPEPAARSICRSHFPRSGHNSRRPQVPELVTARHARGPNDLRTPSSTSIGSHSLHPTFALRECQGELTLSATTSRTNPRAHPLRELALACFQRNRRRYVARYAGDIPADHERAADLRNDPSECVEDRRHDPEADFQQRGPRRCGSARRPG